MKNLKLPRKTQVAIGVISLSLITWKSDYNDVGDYLKGLTGATPYYNVSADIYGAALHDNQWKGRRLILKNN